MVMYCVVFNTCFDGTAYTNLANTFRISFSIEKQRSVVDARGLDLQNDI